MDIKFDENYFGGWRAYDEDSCSNLPEGRVPHGDGDTKREALEELRIDIEDDDNTTPEELADFINKYNAVLETLRGQSATTTS